MFWFKRRKRYRPLCGHIAIYCARIMRGHGYPVKIMTGAIAGGREHAQAMAKVNDKWEWLEMAGKNIICGKKDKDFICTMSHDLENFWILWGNG